MLAKIYASLLKNHQAAVSFESRRTNCYVQSNSFNLKKHIPRDSSDLDGRPRGFVFPKEVGIDRVHGGKVVHILKEHL